MIIVFALMLLANPVAAEMPTGLGSSMWAGVKAPQKGMSAPGRAGCQWQPGFSLDHVRAFAVYDDGTGEALYAGGDFTIAGGVTVNHIARWDGTEWSALSGPSGAGMDYEVNALAMYDDGTGEALYAGGKFLTAGDVFVNFIAKWDGTAWSALVGPSGVGMDRWVYALAVHDDGGGEALYAGGYFTHAGGVAVNHIAKWDGTAWSALSVGMNDDVKALVVYDDGSGEALYAGGVFTSAGGGMVNGIAKWDGTTWSALSGPSGTGMNGWVYSLTVFDDGGGDMLYAGGDFIAAGGVTVNSIAGWDGTEWTGLNGPSGTGMNGPVHALATYDNGGGAMLYAGGTFTTAGGKTDNYIAKWNGTAWSALSGSSGPPGTNNPVLAVAVYDDGTGAMLYAGGDFGAAGGVPVSYIAKWDGAEWSDIGGPLGAGMSGEVRTLAVYDDGTGEALYAGGEFITAGGVTVNNIAKWDGAQWSALTGSSGTGVEGFNAGVEALVVYDDGTGEALYAGGFFTTAGGVTVNNIAKWDGTEWLALEGPLGTGVTAFNRGVSALAVYDDGSGVSLFLGGYFLSAGGVSVNYIAKWDGAEWSALSGASGVGLNNIVLALAVYDDGGGDVLFVGGGFTTAGGGVSVNFIAKWNGTLWSDLPGYSNGGMNAYVRTLAVFDDGNGGLLYAGGDFGVAGITTVNRIAKWDGVVWSALSGPSDVGMNDHVNALAVHDGGGGAALYAGGEFTTAGGVTVNRIARWDGTGWSALSGPSGVGINNDVFALASNDDGAGQALFAGGGFTTAGGVVSSNIAKWMCEGGPPSDPTTLIGNVPVNTWSATNGVDIQWSGAVDNSGSGLDGYSVLFDTSAATTPDRTVDIAHTSDPHFTSSGPLVDGADHWFHLRTCDNAAACSDGVHLGPFWIDATAPGVVTGLASTSHEAGNPSGDTTIDVGWTAATDNLSGVEAYGVEFSSSSTWACDEVQDTTGVVATSSALADGQWYVHVCAVDAAGNWGGVASAGPFVIDTLPPEVTALGSEGGTADGLLTAGESALIAISQLMVNFSEPVSNPGGDDTLGDLTNPEHYRLVELGPDRVLNTVDCTSVLEGDDADISLGGLVAWTGDQTVSVTFGLTAGLPVGRYTLMVCDLQDPIGNQMAGLWTREFAVNATNLLDDPNFDDAAIEMWDTESPGGSDIQWGPTDPSTETSGVAIIDTVNGAGETYELTQCIEVFERRPYGLSGISYIESTEVDAPILKTTVRFYRNAGCTDLLEYIDVIVAQGDTADLWLPRRHLSCRPPAEALSARVGFVVEGGTADDFSLYLDEAAIFEDLIFVDGFETGDVSWWSSSMP